MLAFGSILGDITGTVMGIIHSMGYTGVFIVMTIESAGIPIPSEVVMPYAGFLASDGGIAHLLLVAAIGCLGTGLGSAIGYGVGRWGGKPFINKYGKYLGVTPDKMLWAERFFCKYGEAACIYTRLLPVVRTFVNVPAGLLGMDFPKFMAYTMIGAFPWCLGLASIGYILGDRWEAIVGMADLITYAFLGVIAVLVLAAAVLYVLIKRGVVKQKEVERYLGFMLHV